MEYEVSRLYIGSLVIVAVACVGFVSLAVLFVVSDVVF